MKSQLGAGSRLPTKGTVCITVKNGDKAAGGAGRARPRRRSVSSWSRRGAPRPPSPQAGIPVTPVNKVKDGRPHIVDMLKEGEIQLVFTTVDETRTAIADSRYIRTGRARPAGHLLHHAWPAARRRSRA